MPEIYKDYLACFSKFSVFNNLSCIKFFSQIFFTFDLFFWWLVMPDFRHMSRKNGYDKVVWQRPRQIDCRGGSKVKQLVAQILKHKKKAILV